MAILYVWEHLTLHYTNKYIHLCGPPQPWPVHQSRSGSGWHWCHRTVCVFYGPLCCRHCRSPSSRLAMGLGGWSLWRERFHLVKKKGRFFLESSSFTWTKKVNKLLYNSNPWACFRWQCRFHWLKLHHTAWWSHCSGSPSHHQAPDQWTTPPQYLPGVWGRGKDHMM